MNGKCLIEMDGLGHALLDLGRRKPDAKEWIYTYYYGESKKTGHDQADSRVGELQKQSRAGGEEGVIGMGPEIAHGALLPDSAG